MTINFRKMKKLSRKKIQTSTRDCNERYLHIHDYVNIGCYCTKTILYKFLEG